MSFKTVILMKKPADGGEVKIKSLKDLADQTDIKYGVVKDGATENFFKQATDATNQKIYQEMMKDPALMAATSDKGVEKVRKDGGKYAFIIEASTGEYWEKKTPCDLVSVPVDTIERSYAIAVKKGSPLKAELSTAIDGMKSDLDKLKAKWWANECSAAVAPQHYGGFVLALAVLATILKI